VTTPSAKSPFGKGDLGGYVRNFCPATKFLPPSRKTIAEPKCLEGIDIYRDSNKFSKYTVDTFVPNQNIIRYTKKRA